MKKTRTIILFIVFSLLLSAITTSATSEQKDLSLSNTKVFSDDQIQYAEDLINCLIFGEEKYTIKGEMTLYQFSGNATYTLYILSPQGYAIYNPQSRVVEELSAYSTEIPYPLNTGEKYYYGGPESYYVSRQKQFINLADNSNLSTSEISALAANERSIAATRQQADELKTFDTNSTRAGMIASEHYITNRNYFEEILQNNFPTNPGNHCTHVACSILLGYYDDIVDDTFFPTGSPYDNPLNGIGTTEALLNLLCEERYFGNTSTTVVTASNGLRTYFDDNGQYDMVVNHYVGNHQGVYDRVAHSVSNLNRPMLIVMRLGEDPDTPDPAHSVVVYGYTIIKLGSFVDSIYYNVHTGWRKTPLKTYAYEWTRNYLYIN